MTTAKNRRESFFMSLLYAIGFSVTFAVIGVIFLAGVMSLKNRVMLNIMAGSITIILAIYVFFNKEIQKFFRKLKKTHLNGNGDLLNNNKQYIQKNSTKQEETLKQTDFNGEIGKTETSEKSVVNEKLEVNEKSETIEYSKYGGAFILGFSTGSSWIACVTPVFTTILAIGSVQGDYATALYLMITYGIGIMVPFIIIGTIVGTLNSRLLAKVIHIGSIIERLFAILLLWIGIEILLSAFNIPGILNAF
ncbi:MAG: hypothetical protein K9W44_08110 [Candidatus Lokiarchaeota archaeon]|nr:hypothetical protein [Candidatus Harpocratesius repetitus]